MSYGIRLTRMGFSVILSPMTENNIFRIRSANGYSIFYVKASDYIAFYVKANSLKHALEIAKRGTDLDARPADLKQETNE